MAKDYSGREALQALMKLVKSDLYTKVDKSSILGSLGELEVTDDPNAVLGAGAAKELEDRLDEKAEELEKKMNDTADELEELIDTVKGETQDTVGQPNGITPLDESGKVDAKYLPGYVDDVIEMQWVDAPEEAEEDGSENNYDRKFGQDTDPLGNWLVEVPADDETYIPPLGNAIAVKSDPGVDAGTYATGTTTAMKMVQVVDDTAPDMRVTDLTGKMDKITALTLKFTGPEPGEAETTVDVKLDELESEGDDPEALRAEIEEAIETAFQEENQKNAEGNDPTYYEYSDPEVSFTRKGIEVTFKVTLKTLNADGTKAKTTIDFTGLYGNDVIGDTITVNGYTFKFVLDEEDLTEAESEIAVVVTYKTSAADMATALKDAIEVAESEHPEITQDVEVTVAEGIVTIEADEVGADTTIKVTGTNVAPVEVVKFVKGKIYVDVANNYSYRWSGSALVLITSADLVEITKEEIESMWEAIVTPEPEDDEDDDEDDDDNDGDQQDGPPAP